MGNVLGGIGDWLNVLVLLIAGAVHIAALGWLVVRLARRRTPDFPDSDGEHL